MSRTIFISTIQLGMEGLFLPVGIEEVTISTLTKRVLAR